MLIIDKCKGDREKALFYVRRTIQNGWSRSGLLVCKDHNRVLAKYHLEELGLPMGITDYELKKVLPTQAQLAKCYADAERDFCRIEGETK